PGARLLFAGAGTSLEFVDAVHCLMAAGARVVVDDLGFYDEPYFEDGPVALAVRDAVAAGVVWVSAAGNDALVHHERQFLAGSCLDYHNFRGRDPAACTSDLVVPANASVDCVLQWNDPFDHATNDYDLFLVDETMAVVDAGVDVQAQTGVPIEHASWFNPGPGARTLGVQIRQTSGEPRMLELFCLGGALEFYMPYGSIFGQPAVAGAIAVGAVDVHAKNLATVELFSSWGPSQLFYPPEIRPKPDLVACDGVTTSVPGYSPFYGTSAAAPHVAAVAALMLAKNPFFTPAGGAGAPEARPGAHRRQGRDTTARAGGP